MNYKIKKIVGIIIVSVLFSGCFDDEKKKAKPKRTVSKLVSKVVQGKATNKTLSQEIQEDGIVVDGSRDEELLDAFGLAVSQVIVEDGVSVPDCSALEKTGYLSKEECDEISTKYFGFYDIKENGEASKVDDVFKTGIAGGEIQIKENDTEFFDSSGNPLLNNQVEFEDVVANSDDLNYLNKLKNTIPKNKVDLLKNINAKINIVEDRNVQQTIAETKKQVIEVKNDVANVNTNNTVITGVPNVPGLSSLEYASLKARLANLINTHRVTENLLNANPDNEQLIDKFNAEVSAIADIESKLE